MNLLLLLIDAVGSFIRRNPIFCLTVLLLAVCAPAFLRGIAAALLYFFLFAGGILIAGALWLRWRLDRIQKQAGRHFEAENGSRGFDGRTTDPEGEVKIFRTNGVPEKRVKRDVGDYVEFEETKEEKK